MKQFLFDAVIHTLLPRIKQQAVRKFVLAQNVNKIKHTFTFESQLFGSFGSLEVRLEIKEGLVYFKTLSKIQEDFLTHSLSTYYRIQCTVCLCIIKCRLAH